MESPHGIVGAEEHENPKYVPHCLRFRHPEATGCALDAYGRATASMASLFLGPALLDLAMGEAGENGRVHGFRPTSLLTNIAIVAGLLVAVSMPFFGAVVDHTTYRRQVGLYSGLALALVKAIETCVSAPTWFYVAWLQIASAVLYNVHLTANYAYVSELSKDPNEKASYNSSYNILIYTSTLQFMVIVLVVSTMFSFGDIGTARVSQVTAATTTFVCMYIGWTRFLQSRPALQSVPEGLTLWTCGFVKVWHTAGQIRRLPLRWVCLSILFAEAATQALTTLAVTYLKDVLKMGGTETGMVFLVVLICGIPGSQISKWTTIRYSPVTSAKICDVLFITTTSLASALLKGPDDKVWAYAMAAMWGIELGWLLPAHTTAFMELMPPGSESELMGIYLFMGNLLAWLPPLLFTVLNEHGVPLSVGLSSLNIFFFIGFAFLFGLGDYRSKMSIDEVELT